MLWLLHQQWLFGVAAFVFIVPPFFSYALFQREVTRTTPPPPTPTLMPNSHDAIMLLDVGTGKFIDANPKALGLFKCTLNSIRQMGLEDLSPPYQPSGERSRSLAKQKIAQALNNGNSLTFEWVHQNTHGEVFPCEVQLDKSPSKGRILLREVIHNPSTEKSAKNEHEKYLQIQNRRTEELAALAMAGASITSSLKPENVLQVVARQLTDLLDVQVSIISEYDSTAAEFSPRLRFVSPTNPPRGSFTPKSLLDKFDVERVLEHARPLQKRSDDVKLPAREKKTMTAAGISTYVLLPLIAQNKAIGLIELQDTRRPRRLSDDELHLAQTLCQQAAIAIENARLFQETHRQLAELTILKEVATAIGEANTEDELIVRATQLIRETLYPDNFGVLLLAPNDGELYMHPSYEADEGIKAHRIPLDQGVTGRVAASGKPIRVGDIRKEKAYLDYDPATRSELCVPMTLGGRVIGVVNTESQQVNHFTGADERLLLTFASQLASGIERLRRELAERRRIRQLAVLNELTGQMSGIFEKDKLYNLVVERLHHHLGYFNAYILSVDDEKQEIFLEAVHGVFGEKVPAEGYRQAIDTGLLGQSVSTGEPVVSNNVKADAKYLQVPGMESVNSELVIPIKIYKKVVALLNVDSEEFDAFDSAEISTLTTLCDQIAIAIESVNLFEATRRQLQELTVLHATANSAVSAKSEDELLERATAVIGATLYPDKFGFLLLDEDINALRPHYSYRGVNQARMDAIVPLGEGISGRVAASGKPWRIPDVSKEPSYLGVNPSMRSELCVPILGNNGRTLGVINAESAKVDNFTEGDMRLLSTIAGQLGTAIEKLRLFESERLQRDQAQTLQHVAAILGAATDSADVLDLILDQLRRVVPFDSASIQNVNGDVLTLRAVAGDLPKDSIGYELSIKDDKLAHPIIYEHRSVLYGDISNHPDWLKAPGASRVKSWLGAPLIARGECLGVLTVDGYTANQFNEDDARLVSSFAIHAGIALENTRLLDDARDSLQREQRLNEMARAISDALDVETVLEDVVRISCELVGTDASSLALVSPNGKDLERPYHFALNSEDQQELDSFPCGQEIAWEVINTGEALLLDKCKHQSRGPSTRSAKKIYAIAGVPVLIGEERIGCLMVYNLQAKKEISQRDLELIQTVGRQAGIAIQNARLFEEIQSAYMQTVSALANAIDVRDRYTSGHSQRLAKLASETGKLLGCSQQELDDIHWAALLHDIGKIGVPDDILQKPSDLDPFERETMRRHPEIGARIVEPVRKLESVVPIIRAHQEKYDGSGYPDGLSGEEIPLVARIISVADAYVAMTDDRVYRKARQPKEAIQEMKRCSGSQFDPKVVKAFLKVLKQHGES